MLTLLRPYRIADGNFLRPGAHSDGSYIYHVSLHPALGYIARSRNPALTWEGRVTRPFASLLLRLEHMPPENDETLLFQQSFSLAPQERPYARRIYIYS